MNKQGPNGIEWTDYSWNVVGGCKHGCRWQMPDGSIAKCYAETVAEGIARASYPDGFEAHYWHPARLEEPLKVEQPSRIFLDSMADLMGHWVPDEQIHAVLDVVRRADWHVFQLLTKNAPRLLKFVDDFPPNLWVGVSMPPTFMFGKRLNAIQQSGMLSKALDVLKHLRGVVRWMSFEPLSFDAAGHVSMYDVPLEWAVIGAASNGRTLYQPDAEHVARLIRVLDTARVPTFFKGNLEWSPWREEFPTPLPVLSVLETATQMRLL